MRRHSTHRDRNPAAGGNAHDRRRIQPRRAAERSWARYCQGMWSRILNRRRLGLCDCGAPLGHPADREYVIDANIDGLILCSREVPA